MITQQAQIKINLPLALKQYVESKALMFGVPLASYIRLLILKDVSNTEYPSYTVSTKTENAYKLALKQKKEEKLIRVKDLKAFFDSL